MKIETSTNFRTMIKQQHNINIKLFNLEIVLYIFNKIKFSIIHYKNKS